MDNTRPFRAAMNNQRLFRRLAAALFAFTATAHAGLVAYWPFNDPASLGNDAAGGSILTASGGAAHTPAGKNGGGLALNGTSQFLSGAVNNLPVGNSTYTQAAWFKPTVLGARGIVGWGNYGATRQVNALRLFDTGNGFRHYWWGADLDATGLTTNLLNGSWHHVATTFDGTTRRIYLNGVQVAQDAPGANGATAANFRIGSTNNGEFFNGALDDVAIYNNALSATEVQSLASGGSPLSGPIITSFTSSKANGFEGDPITLNWNVNTANVTGTFSWEIKYGETTLNTGSTASGSFDTVVPDLAGTSQTVTWTLRAIETGGNNVTNTASTGVSGDPGIPSATSQAGLTTPSVTPLNIILAGSDPNGGNLSYTIVTPPAKGSVSGGSAAARTYTSNPGVYGTDQFTFKVSDGKYESLPATIRLTILTPPLAPTAVLVDDLTIRPENAAGDFLSTLSSPDPNAGEAHAFTLVSGPGSEENANFTIAGHQLRAAVSFAGLTGVPQRIRIRSTDAAGLWVEGSFVLTVQPKPRGVVINEIHYNGAVNTVRNSFIELYNDGATTANLAGWRISGGVDYLFPAGTTIAPGAYLLVAEDPATMLSYYGKTALGPWDNAVITYPDGSKEVTGLSNDGDTVRLRDASNNAVSEVDYENRSPWPAEGNGEGSSIELINPGLDETHGSNWRAAKTSSTVTPPDVTFISAATSGWKYFKGTEAPSATWKDPTGADLTGWLDGTTTAGNATIPFFGFGYADNDDAVLLNDMRFIAGTQVGYQGVYFRKEFTIPAGQMPPALGLRVYVDDGCIVWINGVEIPVRFYCSAGTPSHNVADTTTLTGVTWTNHEAAPNNWDSYTISNLAPYNLVEGTNVIAVLAANDVKTSSDYSFNLELKQAVPFSTGDVASPGVQNNKHAATAAPAIRKVEHTPQSPLSSDSIVVTAKITDPNGVASASLAYQICTAGNFIPATLPKAISGGNFVGVATPQAPNPAFELPANWTSVAMNDDGLGDDTLGGDGIWTATIPPQANRTLVRYRITATDNGGASDRVPYAGDPSLNFGCFVYNGVPDYQGTSAAALTAMPVYHFLTRKADFDQCVAYDANSSQRLSAGTSWNYENWRACFVCNGVVYDHLPYRLKGANGRYTASGTGGVGNGKRAFKFYFHKGYEFDAIDHAGNKYPEKWSTMITENLWENRASLTFSLNEMVGFHLFNQLGIPAPRGHWSHFRTIMQTAEQPDKWNGDFWGLMWVHEDYDRRFLAAHDLKKGNLYKLTRDGVSGIVQFRYQSAFGPTDGSDHDELLANLKGTSTPAYITGRVNLDRWCRQHALCEAIRNYDYWPNGDNNSAYYFYPNYNAANGNKGVLWYLPNDIDATWGPTWNNGHDLVHNSLFNDSASGGGDASTNPTLWPNYFNQIREIRRLLWQPDQVNPLIDEFAEIIRPVVNAEFARWVGGPAATGNYGGLSVYGPSGTAVIGLSGGAPVGTVALDQYVAGMKDFAFDANGGGSAWPGGNVGVGGRAAHLDQLGNSLGENATKYPAVPTITATGAAGFPINDLRFSTSAFSDPQGAGTFAGIQWRVAQVNTSASFSPAEKRLLEINASHDSGTIAVFGAEYKFPVTACEPGKRYRARVRMKDDTGRWSLWSAPVEFTAGSFDPSALTSQIVVSELMYHATEPTAAERAVAAALVPPQTWNDDSFDYVELRNVSASPVDLTGIQFTAGFDFIFPDGAILAPGANILVVQNTDAFNARYGSGKPIAGAWDAGDRLSNAGETLTLQFGLATPAVFSFDYDDDPAFSWPAAADGDGASLVRIEPEDTTRDPGMGFNWRSSLTPSPGGDDLVSYAAWLAGAPEPDADKDGLTNAVEYAMGGNALADSSALIPTATFQPFTVAGVPGTYATLTFQRSNIHEDFSQHVEFSSDLGTWPLTGVQVSSADNGNGTRTEVWRSSIPVEAGTRLFGRVRFTQP